MLNSTKSKVNIACVSLALLGLSVVQAKARPEAAVQQLSGLHTMYMMMTKACSSQTGYRLYREARDDYKRTLYALGLSDKQVARILTRSEITASRNGDIRRIIGKMPKSKDRKETCLKMQGPISEGLERAKRKTGILK